jgi:hypothetical protein
MSPDDDEIQIRAIFVIALISQMGKIRRPSEIRVSFSVT